jgi:integrase
VKRKKINPYGKATFMNGDEAKRYLAAIPAHTIQGRRDRAIMLIFLTLAVRISAIAGLRYGDVRRQGERVFLSYKDKGGDIVEMEVKPVARAALVASLADRGELTPDSPLFCATERGKRVIEQTNAPGKTGDDATADQPLSARHIRRLVKKYADAAFGKGHGIHPHSLRHTAAMLASETGTMR